MKQKIKKVLMENAIGVGFEYFEANGAQAIREAEYYLCWSLAHKIVSRKINKVQGWEALLKEAIDAVSETAKREHCIGFGESNTGNADKWCCDIVANYDDVLKEINGLLERKTIPYADRGE